MEQLLLVIVGILVVVIVVLLVKVYFLRRDAENMIQEFHDRMTTDTNTLITISTRDRYMRKLAAEINVQLRLLRKERQRYQQGDLELKEAVTNIAHDLRTPLTAMNGYFDLLEREEKSETVQRYISQIQNRKEALKHLTEELFRYSVVASSPSLKLETLDIVQILEESLLSFYGTMQERGIRPEIKLPEKPVYRDVDAGAMNRIFSNIISNAIKYSDGDLCVLMREDGCITFTNTAQNMDAVAVGRLFDRFYTVEANRNSSGLGLSIAKTLVERMQGSISAHYAANKLHITLNI